MQAFFVSPRLLQAAASAQPALWHTLAAVRAGILAMIRATGGAGES